MKRIDYQKHADHCIDLDGNRRSVPKDNDFPIVAPPWEEVTHLKGVMQTKCSPCGRLVGVAPATQKILAAGHHEILCRSCFEGVRLLFEMGLVK